jgi:TPP-dependent pyruvate/acetoin dehydrogenase alpha subunit
MTPVGKARRSVARDRKPAFSLISDKKLLALYRSMLECHLLREELCALTNGRSRASIGLQKGHEAILAALTVDLHEKDTLSLPIRDAAAVFLKGQTLRSILESLPSAGNANASRFVGRTSQSSNGIAAFTEDIAPQLYLASGIALGQKRAAPGSIVAVLCSGPEASAGCWSEVLSLASAERLPMIFSVHEDTRRWRQPEAMAKASRLFGVPLIWADAQDAVALYRVVFESLTRARHGRGPTLIACRSGLPKAGTDRRDALVRMEAYLHHRGLLEPELRDKLSKRFLQAFRSAARSGHARRTRLPGKGS